MEPGLGGRERAVGQDPEQVARQVCLKLLDVAPRTRVELAERVRRSGVPDAVAERVLDRLTDVGLVDDEAFAEAWVSSRHAGRQLGSRRLADELRRRGVSRSAVERAVSQLDPDSERAAARALAAARLPRLAGLSKQTQLRRLAGLLARRGYPDGLAREVVTDAVFGASSQR
jgi:regulatory protein